MSSGENIKCNRNILSWDRRRRMLLQDAFDSMDRDERRKAPKLEPRKGLRTIFIETYLKHGYNIAMKL